MNKSAIDLKKSATELKNKLMNATDLNDVVDCFMTNFAENPAWKNKGGKCKVKGLKQFITDVISSKFTVENPSILASHDVKHGIVHGILNFTGHGGMFIYMPETNKGLIAVNRNDLKGGMDYFRFTMGSNRDDLSTMLLSDDVDLKKVIMPKTPDSVQ